MEPRSLLAPALVAMLLACSRDETSVQLPAVGEADAGQPDASSVPALLSPEAITLDLYGTIGNRFWLGATDAEVERINTEFSTVRADRYVPGDTVAAPPSIEHLLVTTAGDEPRTADFGRVQLHLVGSTTGRLWTATALPNFKIDADEFIHGNRIGGEEHLRLNNALVGTIFREKLVFDIFNRLGYPAPRVSFAWVSNPVWGPGIEVPYVVVESYKRQFCERHAEALGGGCANMWEFSYGDVGQGLLALPESCQLRECDPTRAIAFEERVLQTPAGEGFEQALADWVDWSSLHRYQCLSWMLELLDDAVHSWFNNVIVERADGRFQFLPYSIDVSLNSEYPVELAGVSSLIVGCQSDPRCWANTIATCESTLTELVALAPLGLLDDNHAALQTAGMLRPGDEESYAELRQHLERRLEQLPAELEQNRPAPVSTACYPPAVQCEQYCTLPARCAELFPPQLTGDAGVPGGEPTPGDANAP